MILVIAEQTDGKLNRASWETIAAAQQVPGGLPIKVAVLGSSVDTVASELAAAAVAEVLAAEHPALGTYTADGFVQAVRGLIERTTPQYVMLPHTYQTRDFAPQLAASLSRPLIADSVGIKAVDGGVAFVRLRPTWCRKATDRTWSRSRLARFARTRRSRGPRPRR
jgi:electron transfer flavoprotein alpha subunit